MKPGLIFNVSVTPILLVLLGLLGLFAWNTSKEKLYWEKTAQYLELKQEERARVVIDGNNLFTNERVKLPGGGETTRKKVVYVPPEGPPAVVKIPNDPNKGVEIEVRKAGFCLVPGIGLGYGHRFDWKLDVKVFYYQRYGLNFGGGPVGPSATISRHLDDVLKFKNLEFEAGVQTEWRSLVERGSNLYPYVGIRINF